MVLKVDAYLPPWRGVVFLVTDGLEDSLPAGLPPSSSSASIGPLLPVPTSPYLLLTLLLGVVVPPPPLKERSNELIGSLL